MISGMLYFTVSRKVARAPCLQIVIAGARSVDDRRHFPEAQDDRQEITAVILLFRYARATLSFSQPYRILTASAEAISLTCVLHAHAISFFC